MYNYRATLIRVVDGDTIEVDMDLGFRLVMKMIVRLAHINAPEMNTLQGKPSKEHLKLLLINHHTKNALQLVTYKPFDKYGRYLAELHAGDVYINQKMIDDGYAVEYEGVGS